MKSLVGVALLVASLGVGLWGCGDDDADQPDAGPFPGGPLEPFPDHYCPGSDGCTGEGDGTFSAGAAKVSIAPEITEWEWTDENANFLYEIGEPYVDTNGNGEFDPVWIAGLKNAHPAIDVRDGLWATAIVLEWNDIRIALVSLDAIGWFITDIEASLEALPGNLNIDKVIVAATHDHQSVDTIGLWGQHELKSGIDDDYQALVRAATVDAIVQAVGNLEPVNMTVAQTMTVDEGGSSLPFVGDHRDPKIIDPRITLLQFTATADPTRTVGTIVNWSAHPEYGGAKHNSLSSDIVHHIRDTIINGAPDTAAGPAAEGIGGEVIYVQGALGGQIGPNKIEVVAADGTILTEDGFDIAEAAGVNVGRLALLALSDADVAEDVTDPDLLFQTGEMWLVVENTFYHVAGLVRVFDREFMGYDTSKPIDEGNYPFIASRVTYLRIGNVGIATCPGEMHPELFIGGYDGSESWGMDIIDSDNENPPNLGAAPSGPFYRDQLLAKPGVDYALLFGLTEDFTGYVVPPWNYQLDDGAPYIEEALGDHYEETNSVGRNGVLQTLDSITRIIDFEPGQ